jgi:dipeptidyl aminopeptidase/acylaminoacyl peptidase
MKKTRPLLLGTILLCGWWAAGVPGGFAATQPAKKLQEPLPLNVAVTLRSHNSRSSFDLSPDGQWVAHTVASDETISKGTPSFSDTGVPFAEGNHRMEATLTNIKTAESVRLGGANCSSWAPVWSPDGERVAFYSDEGGEAGLWIWEKSSGTAGRFPDVIARPFFGFEVVRWMSDGQHLLCKILPRGMTVAEANALIPSTEETKRFPAVKPDEPSVFVLTAHAGGKKDVSPEVEKPEPESSAYTNRALADLALLDCRDHSVARLAERAKPYWYAFSPDEKFVAYTVLRGWVANAQQPVYDLMVCNLAGKKSRLLAKGLRLSYGIELNWSPDSRSLACISCGQLAKGHLMIVSVADGAVTDLGAEGVPSFDLGDGENPPLWDRDGRMLYAVGRDGNLWQVEAATGQSRRASEIPGFQIRGIVSRPEFPAIWSSDRGRTVWVVAKEREGQKSGIFRVDLDTGQAQAALVGDKMFSAVFNLDASDETGAIAFVAKDQQHLADAWVLDTRSLQARQASLLNASLDRYELGRARLIEWLGTEGQKLRGALLLPPGYRTGMRVPLVVWVYGGANGSNYVNSFGFWGDMPLFNMHVLATRGYGVLFPDAPLREGRPMEDLVETVIPGVNAAIEQGYADPGRLAVMGQSYGSYSTLALICQTHRFKAAVITAAVLHPDLFAAYLEMDADGHAASTGYYEHGQGNMGGTPWEYEDRYRANSPIFSFDRIDTPLLIGQGADDGRLIPSDAVFVGLQIYEHEGHVLTRRANVLDFWERRLEFLAQHLDVRLDEKGAVVYEGERAKSRR